MSGVNKVILLGNLGKDPEVKVLDGNVKVTKLTIATSESYKNKDGQKVEQTEWHNVVLWRGLAELAEKYLRKGSKVYIEGKIRTRSWEDNGTKRYITEIVGDQMTLLDRRQDEGNGGNSGYGAPSYSSAPASGGSGFSGGSSYSSGGDMSSSSISSEPTDDLPF